MKMKEFDMEFGGILRTYKKTELYTSLERLVLGTCI